MKTRSGKRCCKKFVKRTYNQNVSTIRVLWPAIKNLEGKTNDFLLIILRTLVANRALSSVYRIKQLMRGFFLTEKPTSWNNLSLPLSPETSWFASCRDSNLEVIGPILGYFLRIKAEHFCKILSPEWKPTDNLMDIDNIFSICEKAVVPLVIELSVAERTVKQLEKFVHISSDNLSAVKDDSLSNTISGKMIMHNIQPKYYDWAWACLRNGDVSAISENSKVPGLPLELTNPDSIPVATSHAVTISESATVSAPICSQKSTTHFSKKTRSGRIVKERKFFK